MTKKRTAYFYDSRISATAQLRFQLPDGMVALDCRNARVAEIVKRMNLSPPCVVVDGVEFDVNRFFAQSVTRPAVVRYFTTTASPSSEDDEPKRLQPTKPETAIELGMRLAAEREKLFESAEQRRQI